MIVMMDESGGESGGVDLRKSVGIWLWVNEMGIQMEENGAEIKENVVRMKVNGRWIEGYLSC